MDFGAIFEAAGYIGEVLQLIVDLLQVNLDGAGWVAGALGWFSESVPAIIEFLGSFAG